MTLQRCWGIAGVVSVLIVIGTLHSSLSPSPWPVAASVASTTPMQQMKPKVAAPQCESFERAPDAGGHSLLAETDVVHAVHPASFSDLGNCRLKAMASKMSCGEKGCVNGTCFFNACWCQPGFIGEHCDSEQESQPTCPDWKEWSNLVKTCVKPTQHCQQKRFYRLGLPQHNRGHPDQCFTHPTYGAAIIPMERWKLAQLAESILWQQIDSASTGGICDRCHEHKANFDSYASVRHLGHVAEVGCGPFTQVHTLLEARPDLVQTAESITLADPGMDGYLKLKSCPYRNGRLKGVPAFTYACGAEEFPFLGAFDTVIMLNVIEHAWDAFAVLSSVYAALKPGGQFLFHERLLDLSLQSEVYHPIRLKQSFYEGFLGSSFNTIYNRTVPLKKSMYPKGSASAFYFIGTKKWCTASLLVGTAIRPYCTTADLLWCLVRAGQLT